MTILQKISGHMSHRQAVPQIWRVCAIPLKIYLKLSCPPLVNDDIKRTTHQKLLSTRLPALRRLREEDLKFEITCVTE
jgi:hypothetical protein